MSGCTLEPDEDLTVIIGGNATGKSSLLDAIQLVSDSVRFEASVWDGELRGVLGEERISGRDMVTGDGQHDKIEITLEFLVGDISYVYTLVQKLTPGGVLVTFETLFETGKSSDEGLLILRDAMDCKARWGSGAGARIIPVYPPTCSLALGLGVDAVAHPSIAPAWRFVRGISILRLIPAYMRAAGQVTGDLPVPDRYGRDLAVRLHRIQTARPTAARALIEHLRDLVGWVEIRTPVQGGCVCPAFLEGRNPNPVGLAQVSDGSVVRAYLASLVVSPPEETTVYLVDDHGMPFFPGDAARGAELVRALAGTRQVIVATHSTALVDAVGNLENVWKIERTAGRTARLSRIGKGDDLFAEDVALRGIGEAAFAATRPISKTMG